MKLENYLSGNMALMFFIGYFVLITALILFHSATTPLYSEVAESLKTIPLTTILAATPLTVILGILTNSIRMTINRYVFRRRLYALDLPLNTQKEKLKDVISMQLQIPKNKIDLKYDCQFQQVKSILLPHFDEYSIRARWFHDFLDSVSYISSFTVIVIAFRAVALSFGSLELVLLIIYSIAGFFSAISLEQFRKRYTLAEVSLILDSDESSELSQVH